MQTCRPDLGPRLAAILQRQIILDLDTSQPVRVARSAPGDLINRRRAR